MCTALIIRRPDSIIVAANRDEFLRRPALGPTVLIDEPRAVGGLDLEKRGSWFGVTAGGMLALLTNQPEPDGRPRPDRRSRGEVVMQALQSDGRGAALTRMKQLDARDYNSFNLLLADADGAEVVYGRSDSASCEIESVPPGLSILPNGRLNQAGHVKVGRARGLVEACMAMEWPEQRSALMAVLADHKRIPLEDVVDVAGARFPPEFIRELSALCIHTPEYGTRSSSIAVLGPGRVIELHYAAGPPCVTRFDDATGMIAVRG